MGLSHRHAVLPALFAASLLAGTVAANAAAGDDEATRASRWKEIRETIFGDRAIERTESVVTIDAPQRAEDASLVPVTLTMPGKDAIKGVSFIIDDNPTPYAAHFVFGPAADPSSVKLRVRVNTYSDVHAVAETKDGRLYEATQYLKASGGCSAPMGMSDEEAMQGMGDMRVKFGEQAPGKPVQATLMIRHPNFSGMQMNQVTRDYTPARFIQTIAVSYGERSVFTMDGDISIAANPVINFAYIPEGKGPIRVVASDNQGGRWEHSFPVPAPSN